MQKVPYSDTQVPASKSKGQIDDMLKKAGVYAIQWTDTPMSISGKECPVLQFIIKTTLQGVEYKFAVKLQAPLLEKTTGRGYDKKHVPNMNASMRLLHWYVKSKIEAIEYGMEDAIEAFMPRVLVSLPNGTSTTMSEAMHNRPQIMSKMFSLGFDDGK